MNRPSRFFDIDPTLWDEVARNTAEVHRVLVNAGYWPWQSPIEDWTDAAIQTAQERLHRQIGQWARVAHRRVAERAAKARQAMGVGK